MDHDRLFKALLTTFFAEFIELFFPDLARDLDKHGLEFLDKEIFTDVASGERHEVDLVVKARFRTGSRQAFFLIHVENQAAAEPQFPRRMFKYFARLHEKFGLPVYPIVLLSYDAPRTPAADRYEVSFPGWRVLDFRYRAIQLNRLNWRDFLKRPNPVASALMVKMRIPQEDRPYVKLECLRMMARLKLDPARSTLIGTFMRNYLKLTAAENAVYNDAMATSTPKLDLDDDDLDLGTEWGEAAARKIVLRLLTRRFGRVPPTLRRRLGKLTERPLTDFAEELLDFRTIAQAEKWVAARMK